MVEKSTPAVMKSWAGGLVDQEAGACRRCWERGNPGLA
jgi:hypothetical protein